MRLLAILNLSAVDVIKLGLNAGIRTRVVVTVDSILVFQKFVQPIPVNVKPAIEIRIDENGIALALQIGKVRGYGRSQYAGNHFENVIEGLNVLYTGNFQFSRIKYFYMHFFEFGKV
jgi:hypothetical protein